MLNPIGGNVGIGTDSPGAKLEIGNGTATDGITINALQASNNTIMSTIMFENNTDSIAMINAYRGTTATGGELRFGTQKTSGVADRMTITEDGYVGIGTTTPVYQLQVIGLTRIGSTSAYYVDISADATTSRMGQGSNSSIPVNVYGAGDVQINIDSNNNETTRHFTIRKDAISNGTILFKVDESANVFTYGDTTMTGDLTVTGIVTAQEFHAEFVSSSIIYESGSTKFGDDTGDFHDFTGSLNVSGAFAYTLTNDTPSGHRIFQGYDGSGVSLQRHGDTAG